MNSKSGKNGVVQYLDLGFQFAMAIVIGVGGGYWLDSKLGTLPLFFVIGLLFGAASGFLTMYRAVYSSREKESGKDE